VGGAGQHSGAGMVTLGGVDTENCREVVGWAKAGVNDLPFWGVHVEAASHGNKLLSSTAAYALTDTGAPVIAAPRPVYEVLVKRIGAKHYGNNSHGFLTVPCDLDYAPLVLKIGGKKHEITSNTLTDKGNDLGGVYPELAGQCRLLLVKSGSTWYLGDPLFREYCVVHDFGKNRMGFARHKTEQKL